MPHDGDDDDVDGGGSGGDDDGGGDSDGAFVESDVKEECEK